MSGFDWPWSRRTAPILQTEAAECGLACLAMIANSHGRRIDLPGMRRICPPSLKGMTLEALMGAASTIDLSPRALRVEMEELGQLRLPAILHWDMAHFVVLEAVGPKGLSIVDPASGRRIVSLSKAARHFTGVALELTPAAAFQPMEARQRLRLKDLWSRLQGWGSALAQIFALSILLQLTALLLPLYLQLTVDQAIGRGNPNLLPLLLIGFGIVYAMNAVIQALRSWVQLTVGESLSFQLGGNVVRHLLRLPTGFFERRHVGDLMSRIGSIEPVRDLMTRGMINAVVDALLAVTTFAVMALISVPLALLVLATTLLFVGVSLILYPGLRRRSEEEIVSRAKGDSYLMESIRAVRAIKLHGHETVRENGWRNLYANVISASYRTGIYGIGLRFAESALFAAQFLLIVYIGAAAVLAEQLTVGLLIAFLAYRSSFTSSAAALVEQVQNWRLVGLHLDRLSDIAFERIEPVAVQPRSGLLPPPAIRADGVSFGFDAGDAPTFSDLDFDIPAGSMVAIVGPSGAGKTTLMRVLLGLLQPSGGRLLVDGVPLGPANIGSWRERVGAVMQDDVLLTGTLAENIAFFDPHPDQDMLEVAAKLACVHDDIVRMPMGYLSLVGDMGAALSGGQRQRILLARALYRDPDILFLDEGTANLDPETEERIVTMISGLPITRVVVAHRPALVERADIVLQLRSGAISRTSHANPNAHQHIAAKFLQNVAQRSH